MPDDKPPETRSLLDGDALAALAAVPKPGAPASVIPTPAADADAAPAKPARKSRSGTSGAERNRRAKAATGDKPASTPKVKPLEVQLKERFATLAELLSLISPADAAVLKHNGPKLARLFATKYPRLAAQLNRLLGVADELDGLALLGLVVGLIADNHGLLPAKASAGVKLGAMLTGVAPPAKLTADLAGSAGELGALASLFTGAGKDETTDAPAATEAA